MQEPRRWWRALTGRDSDAAALQRRRRRGVVLVTLASAIALGALSLSSPWRLVEARAFDYLSTVAPPALPEESPIIVAIDEPSFAELGLQWPWPRDLHGRLVAALRDAGARSIGVDIIFAEPSSEAADAGLEAALGPDVTLAGDVTLIRSPQADQVIRVEPLQRFTAAGARSGVASIVLDGDGILRQMPEFSDGFAAEVLRSSGLEPPAAEDALIRPFGPARTLQTVSYYQALDPEAFLPPGIFRDRIVVVGLSMQSAPTAETGGADAFATSFTPRTGRLVSGAEIQATVLNNLAGGLFVARLPAAVSLALVLGAALLAGLAVWRGTGWRTLVAAAAAVLGFVGGSFLLIRYGAVFAPPLAPSLAFVMAAAGQGARDYARERKLRRGVTRAFSQYLSPVLVDRLAADPSQLKLGGERRTVTVLFCDVRGFTTISERMKDHPEQLTALVNRLLNPLSAVILEHGGTIDKYIGDAIMAFWNAPLDDPDHALHAVEAGQAMLRALDLLNARLAAEAQLAGTVPIELRIGVGVNTGDCVVGNMGSDIRFNYSVLGDAVNLASRLEGETKTYGVPMLVGETTAAMLADRLPLAELDRVQVKGKTLPSAVFTPVSASASEALGAHAALLADHYAGRIASGDARLTLMSTALPELAGYYSWLGGRAGARHEGRVHG